MPIYNTVKVVIKHEYMFNYVHVSYNLINWFKHFTRPSAIKRSIYLDSRDADIIYLSVSVSHTSRNIDINAMYTNTASIVQCYHTSKRTLSHSHTFSSRKSHITLVPHSNTSFFAAAAAAAA